MIIGIGMDLIELNRIQSLTERKVAFYKRILTDQEQKKYHLLSGARKIEFLAGRFAAKEALAKAAGSGIGKSLSFQDIHILNDENGRPYIKTDKVNERIHLTITHTREYAAAQVVIEEKR